MSAEIRKLGHHTAIYMVGSMLAKLASFLLLPIYTRYLTPADYGILELLSMTIDLVGILAGMTLSSSIFPFYAEAKEGDDANAVISTAAIGMTALSMITAAVGLLLAPALNNFLTPERGKAVYFQIFFLIYIAQTAEVVPFMMCRALQRSVLVVVINLIRLLALIGFNVLFVVVLGMGVMGILISTLVVSATVSIGMLIFLFRNTGFVFSAVKFKKMARFAFPVAFVSLGNFFLVFSDRYFVNHYVGPAAVGLYGLAYRFGFLISTFVFGPFQQVWAPQRFVIARQANAREVFRRVFLYVNIGLGGTALVIALFVRDVLKVMTTQAFVSAYAIVPFILLAQIVHHWTAYNNLGLFLTKTTKKLAWGSAVAIPVVLVLNFLLIPQYGVWGAVAATLIAYTLRFLIIQRLSQQEYHIDYDWTRIIRLYGILIGAFLIRSLMGDLQIAPSIGIGSALLTAAMGSVYLFILNAREQASLRKLLQTRVNWRMLTHVEQQQSQEPEGELAVRS